MEFVTKNVNWMGILRKQTLEDMLLEKPNKLPSCVSMLDQLKQKEVKVCDTKCKPWKVVSSSIAKKTKNKIRDVVENLDLQPNPAKPVISLSIGDPTVYGNLKTSKEAIEAVVKAAESGSNNGYAACVGTQEARQAVADYLTHDGAKYSFKDIILCSGCSSALEMSITVLADPDKQQNILMPRPGFSIYQTLAESVGIAVKYYNLLPEKEWEMDLNHLESQIDCKTAAIVLNNPSNPCGSVYTEKHLRDFLEIAFRKRIPVIADEIYERIVFQGYKFVSVASLNSGVPILICGGLAKRFLVPGWRLGWIAIHDEVGAFDPEVRRGLQQLSQRIIGSNTIIQGALPRILNDTKQEFYDGLISVLEENFNIAYGELENAKGVIPTRSHGTMYMMFEVQVHKFPFQSGMEFVIKLMEEESVFCLPGECFNSPGFLRIVLTIPQDLMREACGRITEFCNRHYKSS